MSTQRFLDFMPFIFKWEGGYDNDPDDPGGETNFGIDKRSHPHEDIRNMTKARATEIYWSEYWLPMHGDEWPVGSGEVAFNIAVNAGKGRAIKWTQALVGVPVDGGLGPITLGAIRAYSGPLAEQLLDRTEAHYRSIARGRLAKFLKGWLNRNNDLRAYIAKLA